MNLSMCRNDVDLLQDSDYNEDLERSRRRSKVALRKSIGGLPKAQEDPIVSSKEIEDHLKCVINLHTQNKINAANAWHIKLLDSAYMKYVLSNCDLRTNTESLDVSSKVFAVRVDDVYSLGMKLATAMSQAANNKEKDGSDNEDETTQNNTQIDKAAGKEKKRRKRKRRNDKCILKDPSTCFADVPNISRNSFTSYKNYKNTSIRLLTLCLPTDLASTETVISCYEPHNVTDDPLLEENYGVEVEVNSSSIKIFPNVANFTTDFWNPTDKDATFNLPEDAELDDEERVLVPELDDDIFPSSFDDCNGDENEDFVNLGSVIDGREVIDISKCTIKSDANSEYNYLRPNQDFIMAGPSYWILKGLKRTAPTYLGKTDKQAKKQPRKKKVAMPICFDDIQPLDYSNESKVKKATKNGRNSVKDKNSLLFREFVDLGLTPGVIQLLSCDRKLNINELLGINEESIQTHEEIDAEPFEYNESFVNNNSVEEEVVDCQRNLVEAPEIVERDEIFFVKKAKNFNVKKIKKAMWKIIKAADSEISYSDLHNNIESTEKLEYHATFVALLHLANEKKLLVRRDELKNIKISEIKED